MDATDEHIFQISDLHSDEARLLFKKRVGEDIFERKEYKDIASELLEKCPRLPLSLNVLADMLKNQSIDVWKDIAEQLKKPFTRYYEGFLHGTYSILEISYTYLGNEEKKQFFLLCCLFALSSKIFVTDLLRYGVGLGLFQYANSLVDAMRQAYRWANELRSLSLLLEVDISKGEIMIHDDVKEAGKFFVAKGDHAFHVGAIPRWLKSETCRKYAAISMVSDNNYDFLAGLDLPKLQLLRLLGVSPSKLGDEYFSGMQNVKVLDLSKSDFERFPSSIDSLRNVETLLLEDCFLKDISKICNLVKVQVLSLRRSSITKLSEEAGNLVNLKVLDLTGCGKLEEISSGVFEKLTQLEGLYMMNSFTNWQIEGHMASLSELEFLPLLQVLEVEIKSIEQLPSGDFFIPSILSFKILLGEPSVEKGTSCLWDLQVRGIHASQLVKKGWTGILKKTSNLCLINVHDLGINMEGKFIMNLLCNLQELKLEGLSGLEYALPVQNAVKLKVLKVKDCCDLKYVFYTSISTDLEEASNPRDNEIEMPYLEEVELTDLQSLQGICSSHGLSTFGDASNSRNTLFTKKIIFPALEKLNLNCIGNIEELWDLKRGEEFIKALPKLKCVSLENMTKLRHVWRKELGIGSSIFPYLKVLTIKGCSNLETLCPALVASGFQQLELLEIRSCENMVLVISTEDESEAQSIITKTISFPKLLSLYLGFSGSLKCFYSGSLYVDFTALKWLALRGLGTFEMFAKSDQCSNRDDADTSNQGDDAVALQTLFLCDTVSFPSLEGLGVYGLETVAILWDIVNDDDFAAKFPKLEKMYIYSMARLRHVSSGGIHSLGSLKNISICYCDVLESFFSSPSALLHLPQSRNIKCLSLIRLNLRMLPRVNVLFKLNPQTVTANTTSICAKANRLEDQNVKAKVALFNGRIELPSLEELAVSEMPQLENVMIDHAQDASSTSAILFPELRTLYLKDLPVLKCKHFSQAELKNLLCLYVCNLVGLRCLFSSVASSTHEVLFRSLSGLAKLQQLTVKDCDSLEHLLQVEDNPALKLPALKRLTISRLCRLKHIPWPFLLNIQSLRVTQCLRGHRFLIEAALVGSGSLVLQQLEYLKIKKCDDIEAIISEQDEQVPNTNVVSFPLLKEIKLMDLPFLSAFSLAGFDIQLPCLESVKIEGCYSVRLFSSKNVTAPNLSNVEIDMETVAVDQGLDITLQHHFNKYQKEVEAWPKTLKHKLHEEHELKLVRTLRNKYNCDKCQQPGDIYAFCCLSCKYFLHPTCALVYNELVEEPNEMKAGQNWQRSLNHQLHEGHQLKLLMGHLTRCIACWKNVEFYSYHCDECIFDLHPHCILEEMLVDVQDSEREGDPNLLEFATETSSSKSPAIKYWPKAIKHKLHQEHELRLAIMRQYMCDDCKRMGYGYTYCCRACDFDLHSVCALKENQLMDEPDELKVAKDWPRLLMSALHREHELQLVMGTLTTCDRCGKDLELFSYRCWQCNFDLHPECAIYKQMTVPVPEEHYVASCSHEPMFEELMRLIPRVQHLIGGSLVFSKSHQGIDVINPATQESVCSIPLAPREELKAAVRAAREAYLLWRDTSVTTRQCIMLKFQVLIRSKLNELAMSITNEQGKIHHDAKGEILVGLELVERASRCDSSEQGEIILFGHIREPVGVCAGIASPDFPALIPIWMVSVAIMCGNTFILKPSEKSPGASMMLADLAIKAGLPNGVLNIIHGTNNIVNAICDDDDIQAVSYVGSRGAGMHIYHRTLNKGKRVQCYAWAMNHSIVMPDAHIDLTLWSLVFGRYLYVAPQSSRASLGCMIVVGESGRWESELVRIFRDFNVNAGEKLNAHCGPVISIQDKERICNLIQSAVEAGAELLLDGRNIVVSGYERGNFIGPTVISDVNPHMECYREDINGPVILCMQVNNLEEAIDIVNNDIKRNRAAIFTLDSTTIRKFQSEVKVGQIGLNRLPTRVLPFTLFVGESTSAAADTVDSYAEAGIEFYTQLKTNSADPQLRDPPYGVADSPMPHSE